MVASTQLLSIIPSQLRSRQSPQIAPALFQVHREQLVHKQAWLHFRVIDSEVSGSLVSLSRETRPAVPTSPLSSDLW